MDFKYEQIVSIVEKSGRNLKELDAIIKKMATRSQYKLATNIWPVHSFMNNSCDENTVRFSVGDYQFVITKRDIK